MYLNKKLIVGASALGIIGTATLSTGAFAATNNTDSSNTNTNSSLTAGDKMSSLVEKIATKFNLNKDDVQKVFDEDRQKHHQAMQQRLEDTLTQAVKDGKLTEDQKSKLLAKMDELHTKYGPENNQSISRHAMRQNHQAELSELQSWARENGINLSTVLPTPPHGGHGFGGDPEAQQ